MKIYKKSYVDLIGADKIDKIAQEMIINKKFCNFMLVNLQNVFRYLRTKDCGKYNCLIIKQDTRETEDLYQLTTKDVFVGFLQGQVPNDFVELTSDSQIIDFNTDLTKPTKTLVFI